MLQVATIYSFLFVLLWRDDVKALLAHTDIPSNSGLVFLLFLCRTENLIIQWVSENVLIEIWHVFSIYYSGIGAS